MIRIFGHSDDLIEVEKDGEPWEEFSVFDSERFLHFSDGTVVRCEYGQGGKWSINAVKFGSVGEKNVRRLKDQKGSDVGAIDGSPAWVECWTTAEEPTAEELIHEITQWDEADWEVADAKTLLGIYRSVKHL